LLSLSLSLSLSAASAPQPPHTPAYVSIRQHTSAYVYLGREGLWRSEGRESYRQALFKLNRDQVVELELLRERCDLVVLQQSCDTDSSLRQHTSPYVSICQRASPYVSTRQHTSAYVCIRVDRCVGLDRCVDVVGWETSDADSSLGHSEGSTETHTRPGAEGHPRKLAANECHNHHTSPYVSMRQHTSPYASAYLGVAASRSVGGRCRSGLHHTSAHISIREDR
jgi:hypothetical protein